MLGQRKNVNLPGVHVDIPVLTAKDIDDLQNFCCKNKMDFVAASFVQVRGAGGGGLFVAHLDWHLHSPDVLASVRLALRCVRVGCCAYGSSMLSARQSVILPWIAATM